MIASWLVWLQVAAWAWIIIIGGLMFTPDGRWNCIVCGESLSSVLPIVTLGIGVFGLVSSVAIARAKIAAAR